jgi:outer membrane receptor protein involved in Fe transport
MPRLARVVVVASGLILSVAPASAQPPAEPPIVRLPPVEVIEPAPLPALGIPIRKYPGNVQSVTGDDIVEQQPVDLADTLYRSLGAVNINSTQSNPFQNDVTYRGFLASPLTGSPIGLSVYVDGMRFNDGFGDTVNWDLIPRAAVAGIDVIPGSNPIFGLNTLGGALAVRTKTGRDFPGTVLGASGGSFGRRALEAEHGGAAGPVDWYVTAHGLDEDGWRDESPSELRQVLANLGWETAGSAVRLTYAYADNDLVGNGFAPERTLARDRSAVHTFPDRTRNVMHLGQLRASHWLTDDLRLSANAFYRDYRRRTLNGDAEVVCVDDATGEPAFATAGVPVHLGRCRGSAVGLVDEDGNALAGTLTRVAEGEDRTTRTLTRDWGGAVQLSHRNRIRGRGNAVTLGIAYDRHASRFTQRAAEAVLIPRGASVGTTRTSAFETDVDVATTQENIGAYVTDTLDLTEQLALTLAGRYQHVRVGIRDRSGDNPALDGDHRFARFSPAAGLTYQALAALTLFAAYSEGFRAPTAAELTCADEDDPCSLPNAFVADPPLDPVVARTWEVGARGTLAAGDRLRWNLALFRTDLQDDILFTVVRTGGAGFFRNVSQTRRQGFEASLTGERKPLSYFVSYAYVDATYETRATLASVTEAAGVAVRPGDRIPGIPRHNLKLGLEYAVRDDLWLGASVIAVSGSSLRGDDANRQRTTDGYALLNLHARYQPVKHLEIWARADNVTDAEYETAGALNFNAFGRPIAVERFVSPGPGIAGWAGVRLLF